MLNILERLKIVASHVLPGGRCVRASLQCLDSVKAVGNRPNVLRSDPEFVFWELDRRALGKTVLADRWWFWTWGWISFLLAVALAGLLGAIILTHGIWPVLNAASSLFGNVIFFAPELFAFLGKCCAVLLG